MTIQTYTRNTRPPEYALPYIQNTLNGNYLPGGPNGNPYLDRTFDMAALRTQNQLSSEFARSGRNVEASEALRAQQLGDLGTQIYGGAYDAERNRQNGVLGYAGSDQVSTAPLHRDRIGELLGGLMMGGELLGTAGDLYDQYFGDDAIDPGQAGTAADAAGAATGVLGSGVAGAGGAAAAGGASAVPGGSVAITDAAGNILPSVAGGAGAAGGLAGLAAGAHTGAMAGVGASTAAGGSALLGGAAPTLAPLGGAAAGGAAGGGAGAAGAGAAAGGLTAGLAASLGIAAIPLALAATTPFGDEAHDENSQLGRAYRGLDLVPIRTPDGRNLLMLPNGEFISADGVQHSLDDRYGKEPNADVLNWLMSQPRIEHRFNHQVRPRTGPNAPRADYR